MATPLNLITTYMKPSECETYAEAHQLVQCWERKLRTLPKSAPKRMRKGYEDGLAAAQQRRGQLMEV